MLRSQLSRVSNARIRQQADWKNAPSLLLARQLVFLGKVVREDADGPLHRVSFIPGTDQPATSRYVRKLGRPRKEWISNPMPEAYRVAGFPSNLDAAVQDKVLWKRMVKTHTSLAISIERCRRGGIMGSIMAQISEVNFDGACLWPAIFLCF